MQNLTDKQAIAEWEEFLDSIRNSTPVDLNETKEQKAARMARLEKPGNQEEWFKYYFPKFCFAEPAPFQINSTKRILAARRLRQSRKWARGLAKSTRRMFEVFYLMFVRKFPVNAMLASKTETNAILLLSVYRAHLEANPRLINDYGTQQRPGAKWTEHHFITRNRCSFRAVGRLQNPRGAKLDEIRINIIIADDLDDDEICNNTDRLNEAWNWFQRALVPTVEISKPFYIFFDNNIIAEDCLALRFADKAEDSETVNLRDENNTPTWAKNTEEDIQYMFDGLSYEDIQTEYYNNPMSSGKTFTEPKWGKCPPLHTMPFVLQYGDPSTSNKDKPAIKSKAQNSTKAVVLLGQQGDTIYIYKAWVDNTTNANFINWLYNNRDYVGNQCLLYSYIENNTLQDPFYEQVLQPLIFDTGRLRGGALGVLPDARKKPEKWFRIEAALEPLWRNGRLVFNEAEMNDPHMKRLIAQFRSAKATSKTLDGPDAVEGGVFICREKYNLMGSAGIETTSRASSHKKRT